MCTKGFALRVAIRGPFTQGARGPPGTRWAETPNLLIRPSVSLRNLTICAMSKGVAWLYGENYVHEGICFEGCNPRPFHTRGSWATGDQVGRNAKLTASPLSEFTKLDDLRHVKGCCLAEIGRASCRKGVQSVLHAES